jgi:hypothetical protein
MLLSHGIRHRFQSSLTTARKCRLVESWDLQGSRAGLIDKPLGDARAHDDFQAIVCSIAHGEDTR